MSKNTKIEWCDHTFNPWIGCQKVSPGCKNCYAEAMDKRWGRDFTKRRRTSGTYWKQPLQWNEDARVHSDMVFCGSMCDWLDDEVPVEWLAQLLALISRCPNLDFLLLTKRPENWKSQTVKAGEWLACFGRGQHEDCGRIIAWLDGVGPHNVWLGVSAENQEMWDKRVPLLMQIPAVKRFVSVEPMLGPIVQWGLYPKPDWVIFGGESGPNRRPFEIDWLRSGVEQCDAAGVKVFVKQDSALKPGQQGRIPDNLWVRKEWPV